MLELTSVYALMEKENNSKKELVEKIGKKHCIQC